MVTYGIYPQIRHQKIAYYADFLLLCTFQIPVGRW